MSKGGSAALTACPILLAVSPLRAKTCLSTLAKVPGDRPPLGLGGAVLQSGRADAHNLVRRYRFAPSELSHLQPSDLRSGSRLSWLRPPYAEHPVYDRRSHRY